MIKTDVTLPWPERRYNKFLFDKVLHLFSQRGGRVIVEIGTIRDPQPKAQMTDGWATLKWASTGLEVHTVDLDPRAIGIARTLTDRSNVKYHLADGVKFLTDFQKPIDLLYLDGPDADQNGQSLALEMFMAAGPILSKEALVLIDDCDKCHRWEGRGKGELVIPHAIECGFQILEDNGRQVLLSE